MKTALDLSLSLFVLIAVVGLVAACGDETSAASDDAADASFAESAADGVVDFVAQAEDFRCLKEARKVDRVHLHNPLGLLDDAEAVARAGVGEYPVGTILQLVPQEAMVKRAPGYNPETRDWELFYLEATPEGTRILARGGKEVRGAVGHCADCHSKAPDGQDFTCRDDEGCDPNPHAHTLFALLVEHDPRCND